MEVAMKETDTTWIRLITFINLIALNVRKITFIVKMDYSCLTSL